MSLHSSYPYEPTIQRRPSIQCALLGYFWKEKRSNVCSSKLINIWIALKWAYHHPHAIYTELVQTVRTRAALYGHDSSNNDHALSNRCNFKSTKNEFLSYPMLCPLKGPKNNRIIYNFLCSIIENSQWTLFAYTMNFMTSNSRQTKKLLGMHENWKK